MKTTAKKDKKRAKKYFRYPAGTKAYLPEWVEHLKTQYNGSSRPCRHAFTGRINAPKICAFNYECFRCAFDQMLDEPVWKNTVLSNASPVPVNI